MSNTSYLKDLVWFVQSVRGVSVHEAQGAGITYMIVKIGTDIEVRWDNQMKGKGDKRGGFNNLDEAKEFVELEHYPHTMQPYVKECKPIPQTKKETHAEYHARNKWNSVSQGNWR